MIHPVKCKICNKKRFRGFRYQCEDCSNYHMCQVNYHTPLYIVGSYYFTIDILIVLTTSSKNAFIDYNNNSEMNVANNKEKLIC